MSAQNVLNAKSTIFEAVQDVYNREISYLTQEMLKNQEYENEIKNKIIKLREERKNLRKLELSELVEYQKRTDGISDRFVSSLK